MLKLRIFFIYLVKLLERESKWFIGIGLLLLLILFALIKLQAQFFKPTISEGLVGTYTSGNLPVIVTNLLTKRFVDVDQTGQPVGNVASSWSVDKDGTSYTFKIDPNLNWSDGTKLRAYDLDFSIPGAEMTVVDENTVSFKITDPYSPFPTLLNKPVFKKNSGEKLIGLGNYSIQSVKKDPTNQVFITTLVLGSKDKSLPNIKINFYDSERKTKEALRLGDIESILGVNDTTDLSDKTLGSYSKTNYQQMVTIFYNTKDPILSDDNFRLALSFGAPTIKGETEAQTSIAPNSWAFNSEVKDYLDNLEAEKASMKKVKNGANSTITLTATSFLQGVGSRIVEAWNKAGIKAVLRVESGIPQNFQALLIAQNIPSDPDQYSLWHSTQAQTNISQFSNPRVDKDLEDGRKEQDLTKRKGQYQDFQKVLLDHAPATFLYFPKYNVIYRKKIEPQLKKVLDVQLAVL